MVMLFHDDNFCLVVGVVEITVIGSTWTQARFCEGVWQVD